MWELSREGKNKNTETSKQKTNVVNSTGAAGNKSIKLKMAEIVMKR